jgi:hypothetical protein
MLFVFMLGCLALLVSCQHEESDYEQGKIDGKAACDCYHKLGKSMNVADEVICDSKVDESRMKESSDYAKGVYEIIDACELL